MHDASEIRMVGVVHHNQTVGSTSAVEGFPACHRQRVLYVQRWRCQLQTTSLYDISVTEIWEMSIESMLMWEALGNMMGMGNFKTTVFEELEQVEIDIYTAHLHRHDWLV